MNDIVLVDGLEHFLLWEIILNGYIKYKWPFAIAMLFVLVGGLEHDWIMTFPSYWEGHNPNWLDSYVSKGVGQPPTSYLM